MYRKLPPIDPTDPTRRFLSFRIGGTGNPATARFEVVWSREAPCDLEWTTVCDDLNNWFVEWTLDAPDAYSYALLSASGGRGPFTVSATEVPSVARVTHQTAQRMRHVAWDMTRIYPAVDPAHHDLLDKLWLRVVDTGTGGNINLDDIRFTDRPDAETTWVPESQPALGHSSLYMPSSSPPPPVYGLVDTHAHWMAHLGFGARPSEFHAAVLPPTGGEAFFNYMNTVGGVISGEPLWLDVHESEHRRRSLALLSPFNCGNDDETKRRRNFGTSMNATVIGSGAVGLFVELDPYHDKGPGWPSHPQLFSKGTATSGVADCGIGGYSSKDNRREHIDGIVPLRWTPPPREFLARTWQQMYFEWVKRAWQGGARLMVTHAVNARGLEGFARRLNIKPAAEAHDGREPTPHDGFWVSTTSDRTTIARQTCAMRRAATHPDLASWVEIAYTPDDARRIIHAGKLAIVLGAEVDQLDTVAPSNAGIVNFLRNVGVRHIFPIHVTDNAFGPAAYYSDVFNAANDFLRTGCKAKTWLPNESHSNGFNMCTGTWKREASGLIDLYAGFDDSRWERFGRRLTGFYKLAAGCNPAYAPEDCVDFRLDVTANQRRGTADSNVILGDFVNLTPRSLNGAVLNDIFVDGVTGPGGHVNAASPAARFPSFLAQARRGALLIDIDHMAERAVDHVTGNRALGIPSAVENYPVVAGHSDFRRLHLPWTPAQYSAADESQRKHTDVDYVVSNGGLQAIGLGFTAANGSTCFGSSADLLRKYNYVLSFARPALGQIGAGVGLGSDFNGLLQHIGPRFGSNACWGTQYDPALTSFRDTQVAAQKRPVTYTDRRESGTPGATDIPTPLRLRGMNIVDKDGRLDYRYNYNVTGLANYGLLPDLLQDAVNQTTSTADPHGQAQRERMANLFVGAEQYLRMWQASIDHCRDLRRREGTDPALCTPLPPATQVHWTSQDEGANCRIWDVSDFAFDRRPDGEVLHRRTPGWDAREIGADIAAALGGQPVDSPWLKFCVPGEPGCP